MRITLNVKGKGEWKDTFKTENDLINAVCGTLDANLFKVEYIDHEQEDDEHLIRSEEEKE